MKKKLKAIYLQQILEEPEVLAGIMNATDKSYTTIWRWVKSNNHRRNLLHPMVTDVLMKHNGIKDVNELFTH